MLTPRDVPLLPVFIAVATAGSFTAAARELRLTKSVVSQHVQKLEDRCGGRLLERTTRRMQVTQLGERVLALASDVVASVQRLDASLDRERAVPGGTLRVTASHDLGASLVAPVAARVARRYPTLQIDLVLDDAPRDLVAGRFDVGIRLGPIRESNHVIRRLISTQEILVASPGVFADPVRLRRPRDLAGARWVVHAALERPRAWTFRSDKGQVDRVVPEIEATVNNAAAMREYVLAGACCAVLPNQMVYGALAAGRLVRVCPGWHGRTLWLQALLPSRHAAPRSRVFLDALVASVRTAGFYAAGTAE